MANDVEAMMDLYEQGESLRSIGKQFGLSHERVRQLFEKGDPEFDAEIERVVDGMRDDGTLSELSLRWFGMDLSE